MKLTRLRHGMGYRVTLSPYQMFIYRTGNATWSVQARVTSNRRYGAGRYCRTLEEAKQKAVRLWLQLRLHAVHDQVQGAVADSVWPEFREIWSQCWSSKGMGPLLLRDWLADHGLPPMVDDWILDVGIQANVTWPGAWQEAAQVRLREVMA